MTWWNPERIKEAADPHFANHVATWQNDDVLIWKQPNTSFSYVQYRLVGRYLIVLGDLGEAIYSWSQMLTWEWLSGLDYQYFASKCDASEVGRLGQTWSRDTAEQFLREQIAWMEKDAADTGDDIRALRLLADSDPLFSDPFDCLNSEVEWIQWIDEEPERYDEFWEWGSIGQDIHRNCVLHLEGLKRAFATRIPPTQPSAAIPCS